MMHAVSIEDEDPKFDGDCPATISFTPDGKVKIKRCPGCKLPIPLLFVSVAAVLAWQDYFLGAWFIAEPEN